MSTISAWMSSCSSGKRKHQKTRPVGSPTVSTQFGTPGSADQHVKMHSFALPGTERPQMQ